MTRKRFQHSSEYFGRGLKIVMRLPIVADSCFFSNPEEQNLKGGGGGGGGRVKGTGAQHNRT